MSDNIKFVIADSAKANKKYWVNIRVPNLNRDITANISLAEAKVLLEQFKLAVAYFETFKNMGG